MAKINKNTIEDILSLTPMQEGMLFHYLKNPEGDPYFVQLTLKISGEIDEELFKESWNLVIRTNEMLRTVFRWEDVENPIQVILKKHNLSYEYYDISGETFDIASKQLEAIKLKDREKKFDLKEVPFRIILCKVRKDRYEMILSNHHILYDGWSNGIILKEFISTYNVLSRGEELIKSNKARFGNFVKWMQNQDKNKQERFWRGYLKGFNTQSEIPKISNRGKGAAIRIGNLQRHFGEKLKTKILDFVKGEGITLASLLFGAWGLLLHKYNNCHDVVFGTTVSGRSARVNGIEESVGLFVNTVPLRVRTHSHEKIKDLLSGIEKTLSMRAEFEDTSLVDIIEYSEMDKKGELFDSVFVLENYPLASLLGQRDNQSLPTIDSYEIVEATHYDLTCVAMIQDRFDFNFIYNENIFEKDFIARLTNHFYCVLQEMVSDPGKVKSKIEIISREEKEKLLREFNDTDADYPKDKTVVQLFVEQVQQTPYHTALVGGDRLLVGIDDNIHITYMELDQLSCQFARLLKGKGVNRESIVGIMMERSLRMMIGIFGILKAGCAYMPIDPGFPGERIKYILEDSRADVLVFNNVGIEKRDLLKTLKGDTIFVNMGEMREMGTGCQLPVKKFTHMSPPRLTYPLVDSLSYVIYTSGSTGKPKGVMMQHRSLVNRLNWMQKAYPLDGSDVILQKTPIVFDVSLWELFWWSFRGARLCLLGAGDEKNPTAIVNAIKRCNVTTIHFVPSMLTAFMDYIEHSLSYDLKGSRSLKRVFASGEALLTHHVKQFDQLLKKINHTRLINLYGPTETAVDVSFYNCYPDDIPDPIPIGKPIDNIKLYIVDNDYNLQPLMVVGELYIAGVGVGRGYINNPELTGSKFLILGKSNRDDTKVCFFNKPFQANSEKHPPGRRRHRIYKTGDLARWLADGNIEFLGRLDLQVKIRGFRIELGEIENTLLTHQDIKEAVVIAREDHNKEYYLCGYFTADKEIPVSGLKTHLSTLLPAYMVPSFFVRLESIPLTRNGKVDRRALPEPVRQGLQLESSGIPPKNQAEQLVAEAWQQVLKIDNVGVHDNFFDIGGNSLYIIRLSSKLQGIFHRDVPVVTLFNHPTVSAQARYLGGSDEEINTMEEEVTGISENINRSGSDAGLSGMEIAVIGMAGRFPGARHIDEFWDNLKNGIDCISFFSDEELEALGISAEFYQASNYVKAKGVLENMANFDADFFDYSAREAGLMDPQLRILHECVWEALENAGYESGSYKGRIGLYVGAFTNSWWVQRLSHRISTHAELLSIGSLNERDYLANRVSYKINLKGPALTVQTACSTSLVAVDTACQALLHNKCEIAIAGGVTLTFQDRGGYLYEEGMVRSPDGHCRPFDARANGTMGGNGVGVVVMKRLEKAMNDGDHVFAVIKGSAVNNDGARKVGYTAPSVQGQVEVIRAAWKAANVPSESISYLETHGTGTVLGDPVEIEALKQAFNTDKKGFCAIGAVKANIGHLDAAAGAAGLIKTILALQHRLIPPAVNFEIPNPQIDFENSPFYVNTLLREWKSDSYPLRAGVSSFGIGGTNAHVILEEAPVISHSSLPAEKGQIQQIILLSARTASALEKMTGNIVQYFRNNPGINLADAAYTLQVGRKHFLHRRMLVCLHVNAAIKALSTPGSSPVTPVKPRTSLVSKENKPVVFMFPGLGSQYVGMGRELYEKEAKFREEMHRCFEILKPLLGYDIREILYPGISNGEVCMAGGKSGKSGERAFKSSRSSIPEINRTDIAQPVIFIFEYALARLLIHWGIKPHAMIGYSFGEYTAACLSGVFSLEHALRLIVKRGKLIQKSSPGAMLSVPLSVNELRPLLINHSQITIAIDNGSSSVVSGPKTEVDAFEKQMKQGKYLCMRLPVSHAVHSGMMEPILEEFNAEASKISLKKPQIPYISNVTGKRITDDEAVDHRYWGTHLRETVRFADGLKELMKDQDALFVEVGPGHELSSLLVRHLFQPGDNKNRQQSVINLVRHPDREVSDVSFLLNKVGLLWLNGININWNRFNEGRGRCRISLPSYPFAGKRYWFEDSPHQHVVEKPTAGTSLYKKPDIADWFYLPGWERSHPGCGDQPGIQSRSGWLVFYRGSQFGCRLVERLRQEGNQLITVTEGACFKDKEKGQYEINPGQSQDYYLLLEELRQLKFIPAVIVYLWSMSTGEFRPLEQETWHRIRSGGWTGLLHLVRSLSEQDLPGGVCIHVITQNLHEVTGFEQLAPQQAPVLGLTKVIPQEYPNINCRSIDIILPEPGSIEEENLIEQLYREFSSKSPGTVAAYRGRYRWQQTFFPVSFNSNKKIPSRLKPGGVYLLTGGLGNIGFTLARYLAETLKANLILTGRTSLPSRDKWAAYLADHDGNDERAGKIRRALELEETGSRVLVFNADASDYQRMQEVLDESREHFGHGQIHGVIHAAGIVGGETFQSIAEITEKALDMQFQSKVYSLLVMEKLFRDYQLDFCLLVSSPSSILGGLGFAAYASVNAFIDAFAYWHNRESGHRTQWLAVNWGDWNFPLSSNQGIPGQMNSTLEQLLMTPEQGIKTFQHLLAGFPPNQVIVSAGDLHRRINQWIKLEYKQQEKTNLTPTGMSGVSHQRPDLMTPYVAPTNQIEKILSGIWQTYFAMEQVGIEDNFFELGATSLDIIQLNRRIKETTGNELPVSTFFRFPNIRSLALHLRREQKEGSNISGNISARGENKISSSPRAARMQQARKNLQKKAGILKS